VAVSAAPPAIEDRDDKREHDRAGYEWQYEIYVHDALQRLLIWNNPDNDAHGEHQQSDRYQSEGN